MKYYGTDAGSLQIVDAVLLSVVGFAANERTRFPFTMIRG